MARKKSRAKSFLVKFLIAAVIVALAVGLYFITPKATPPPPKTEVSLTDTPDFNTCKLITTNDIKNTYHGKLVTGISEGTRAGTKAPNGTIADSCGYGLTTEKSLTNSFSVLAYPYTAMINGDNKEDVDASWSEVADSNPKAYFGKDIEGDAVVYKLRVIPGGKNVMFELRQPLKEVAYDEPSALEFLVGIATKADFEVLEPVNADE